MPQQDQRKTFLRIGACPRRRHRLLIGVAAPLPAPAHRVLIDQGIARTRRHRPALTAESVVERGIVGIDRSAAVSGVEGMALDQELGNKQGIAHALGNLSTLAVDQGDYTLAQSLQEAALAIDRELGNKRSLANSLNGLGCIALEQGDYVSARPLQEESLILCREIGDKMGIARALSNLGYIAFGEGDSTTACSLFEQCRELYQKLENKEGIGQSLLNLGILASEKHDYATAHALLDQGLTLNRALDAKSLIAFFLEAFAALAARQQKLERSARLWGAAEAIRKAIGTPLPPYERVRYDRWVMDARDSLGAASFAAAWEQGSSMTIEQAIEYALQSTAA